MGIRLLASLCAGLVLAFAVTDLPASATSQSIAAVSNTGWMPADVSIDPGDSVTWTNGTGLAHNVCVRRTNGTGCGEYRSGSPSASWPSEGFTHAFASDGTYAYICQQHPGMKGTITVGTGINPPTDTGTGTGTSTTPTGTGTGTSTTPPPGSQPTDTTTVPTQTGQSTADTTAPGFTGKIKRRSSRKALTLELSATEPATLKTTVFRRPPRGRTFTRVGQASLHVKKGRNVVSLPRKARGSLRSGSYRLKLQLVDAAGNKSVTKTLTFKLT
jgi:plastocyanin